MAFLRETESSVVLQRTLLCWFNLSAMVECGVVGVVVAIITQDTVDELPAEVQHCSVGVYMQWTSN